MKRHQREYRPCLRHSRFLWQPECSAGIGCLVFSQATCCLKVEHGATYFWSPATCHTKLHATFFGQPTGPHEAIGCMESVACNLVASCGPALRT